MALAVDVDEHGGLAGGETNKPGTPKVVKPIDLTGFGFEVLQYLGRGHTASAQVVRDVGTGQTFVAKCVSLETLNKHDQEFAKQESFLLQSLRNPLIVAYNDSFLIEGANVLVIIMEHCDGGDLRNLIKEKAATGGNFSEDQIMNWFVQIALALQYIHSHKILHRDLKTSNIFLCQGSSTIKLGDFGLSRVLDRTGDAAVTMVGTPYYMSPEVCSNAPYSWKSDVWSLGCVLYELCMLKHAFESTSLFGLVYKITSGNYEPIPSIYSPALNDLVSRLLTKSTDSRPSIAELFSIPYVQAYVEKQDSTFLAAMPAAPAIPDQVEHSPSLPPLKAPLSHTAAPASFNLQPDVILLLYASRVRRRLVVLRMNWLSAFASFDHEGTGALPVTILQSALLALKLGLSREEVNFFTQSLLYTSSSIAETDMVPLSSFEAKLAQASSEEVQRLEAWARRTFEPFSSNVGVYLTSRDTTQAGSLTQTEFQSALQQMVPALTAEQLGVLIHLACKREDGDIDYMDFADAFARTASGGVTVPPAPVDTETPRFYSCTQEQEFEC